MAKVLVNKSARAVIIDGTLFSPGVPVKGLQVEKIKKLHPDLAEMLKSGTMAELDEEEAKAAEAAKAKAEAEKAADEKAFEEQALDELKAYAVRHNIPIDGLKKRGDIISVLKEATNRA